MNALLETNEAQLESETTVIVTHQNVAGLDDEGLRNLSLPPLSNISLELSSHTTLMDPDFRVAVRMVHPNGRPVIAPSRCGCLLTVGDTEAVLPAPTLALLDAVEHFNANVPQERNARFAAWGEVAQWLTDGALVDDRLRTIRVVVPTSITLDLKRNERREVDFDPLLGRFVSENVDAETDETTSSFETLLPVERQRHFAQAFRRFSEARSSYSAGAGWYVILPERVHQALKMVKRAQSAPVDQREEFVRNPEAALRQAIDPDHEDVSFEQLFCDTYYSERVKGVGLWQPKVVPWVTKATNPWLPPEECGLRVDDEIVTIPPDQVNTTLERVQSAMDEGQPTVAVDGHDIPATQATVDALQCLIASFGEPSTPDAESPEREAPSPTEPTGVISLLVRDNLGEVEFEGRAKLRTGTLGEIPGGLRSQLLPHQLSAVRWLQSLWLDGRPGALLADDMGLGKTLEALVFLAWLRDTQRPQGKQPILIVAPTGLLKNWIEEYDKHFLDDGLGDYLEAHGHGLARLRDSDSRGPETAIGTPTLRVRELEAADWVLTTYETLRDYIHSFGRIRWRAVVFDEAQKIKNPAARLTDSAKAVNAEFSIALTGTPVENRLADLWCIVDAVQPGRLGSLREFSSTYESGSVEDSLNPLATLREMLCGGDVPRVMLRRLKEDHLEGLPRKEILHLNEEMPERQAAAYQEVVRRGRDGGQPLEILQGLRNVSLHPYRRDQEGDDEYIRDSARLVATFKILDRVFAAAEKVLLFIESRHMQAYLSEILQRRYDLAAPPLIISGDVAGARRRKRVDIFQDRAGFDVMLVSPKAGGVGLTMTAANHVIHLTRWWNPAIEDQCTDRAYRIGQQRDVFVYVPTARHPTFGDLSFDVILHELLERKRKLNRSVLAPTVMTRDDRDALYSSTVLGRSPTPPPIPEVQRSQSRTMAPPPREARIPAPEPPEAPWIATLMESDAYRRRRQQAPRSVPDDDKLRMTLRVIAAHGGTMTRSALAATLGLPQARVQGIVNGLRDMLNVEGYEVLIADESSASIRLNLAMIEAQFAVSVE